MKDKRGTVPLGCGLILLGIALMQIAIWAFVSTVDDPFPKWLMPIAAIGFWGWWIFVLTGIILLLKDFFRGTATRGDASGSSSEED